VKNKQLAALKVKRDSLDNAIHAIEDRLRAAKFKAAVGKGFRSGPKRKPLFSFVLKADKGWVLVLEAAESLTSPEEFLVRISHRWAVPSGRRISAKTAKEKMREILASIGNALPEERSAPRRRK